MGLKIGVIDSGIGGLSILRAIINKEKFNHFFYVADTKNAPYGNKKKGKIVEYVLKITDFLVNEKHIDILIVACNTASATAKQSIIKTFPNLKCIFVEPPIKLAIEKKYKKILVLATKQTIKSNLTLKYYTKIAKQKNIKVKKVAIKNLATLIDKNCNKLDVIEKEIAPALQKYKKYDAIVLGCTHYNFIKSQIKNICPNSEIVSCEKEIAERVSQILKLLNKNDGCDNTVLEVTLTYEVASIRSFTISIFSGQAHIPKHS